MTKRCSWKDCPGEGLISQLDKNGHEWACLCDECDSLLTDALESGDVKRIMSTYIRAQGGAEKMMSRFMR
jgi:hypothetical protein